MNNYPEVFSGGHLVGWKCSSCNEYNDLLRHVCRSCKNIQRPTNLERAAALEQERRLGGFDSMNNKETKEELHKRFFDTYNKEIILVQSMDYNTLIAHIRELEEICRDGRTMLTAAQTRQREMEAEMKLSDKEWLLSRNTPDPNVSDAISAVKVRKDRMSKADKLLEQMKSLGIADAESMVSRAEKRATDSQMNSVSFNKPKVEPSKPDTTSVDSSKPEETKPFDPSSLFS